MIARAWSGLVGVAIALVGLGCGEDPPPEPYAWDLPAGFPRPAVPADNPMSEAKVALGRRLFYDQRLSINQTTSCGSCHEQARGFADGRALASGATGDVLPRNSPGLQNVAYLSTYTWVNPVLATLEQQVVVPMFGEHPVELGMTADPAGIVARFAAEPTYVEQFAAAFPDEAEPVSTGSMIRALASFVRSMISGGSPYDRLAFGGDEAAMSDAAKRGFELFVSERLECYHCHVPNVTFTGALRVEGQVTVAQVFENDGLYNLGGTGAYPPDNRGLIEFSGRADDEGRFRVPSLRNIALTAPYMHDGSMATLDDVIAMYERGGRLIESGPRAGDGALNPRKSSFVRGFELTAEERADLRAFLDSLTDPAFLADPRFAPP